jgi:hypothetical protein
VIEIVTDFRVLMQKAKALGQAKLSGDEAAIRNAQADHDAYQALCLKSDKMTLGVTNGAL